jgi:hypothetical protein
LSLGCTFLVVRAASHILAVDGRRSSKATIHTTSFKDPIFNGVYQKKWFEHILYSRNQAGVWMKVARTPQPPNARMKAVDSPP